jgi:hypothetical protein
MGESERAAMGSIFGEIEAEQCDWEGFVSSPSHQEETIEGGWSLVDTFVHIASWKENALRATHILADPTPRDAGPDEGVSSILGIDVDAFNDEFMSGHQGWGVEQALEWSRGIHTGLMDALRQVPQERLLGGTFPHGARRWYYRPGVVHPREHRDEVRARQRRRSG